MYVKAVLGLKGYETYSVAPDDSVLTALQLFNSNKVGFAVVRDAAGKVVGGISERDICIALSDPDGAGRKSAVREVMTTDILTCSPDDNLIRIRKGGRRLLLDFGRSAIVEEAAHAAANEREG